MSTQDERYKLPDETGAVLGHGSHAHDGGVAAARERVAMSRTFENQHGTSEALVDRALLLGLGVADHATGKRMLETHLAGLTASERANIEGARMPDGSLRWHHPEELRASGRAVMGPLPRSEQGMEAELAACRLRMRNDPKGWFADDKAQLRYRTILRVMNPE